MEVVLFDKRNKSYISAICCGRLSHTRDVQRAAVFEEERARNILKNNLGREISEKLSIKPAAEILAPKRPPARASPVTSKQKDTDFADDEILQTAIEKYAGKVSETDKELSDLYHFVLEHPSLPADKGYRVYSQLKGILSKRSKLKLRLRGLVEVSHKKVEPYRPRTGVYHELEKML